MKRLMICLLGALAFTAAAHAAEPKMAQATTPATDAPAATQEGAKKPDVNDAYCLRHTGTRITSRTDSRKARTCSNGAIGRAYSRDDLDRTGEISIADALRKLDPAVH
jgi:hypothetical protein